MKPRSIFYADREGLAKAKQRIAAGDAAVLKPALDRLRREADEALRAGPFSVMDKKLVPPSGDKHDYMSVGPYWWPDPAKPDGLPYIRRDGETNPQRSENSTDADALKKMIAAVDTLALAYYLTGHAPYAAHAARLLRVWFLDPATKMNPNLNYGQAIPGRVEGRGIGIIDTTGLARTADAVEMLNGASAWTEKDRQGMVAWFDAYLGWLRASKHGKDEDSQHNNHGTWYDVQVARFALFVGKPALAREVLEGVKKRRIATQIAPDGRQPHELARTKSFSYSVMNLRGMFALAAMGERLGVDLWGYRTPDVRGLRAALDFLAPYADPSRKWPHPQIGTPPKYGMELAPLLRQGARAYRDGSYAALLEKVPEEELSANRVQFLHPDGG